MAKGRYTVLGSTGFIGSRLAAALRAAGHEVATPPRDADLAGVDLGRAIYCIGRTSNYKDSAFGSVEAHVGVLARLLETAHYERFVYLSSTRLYDQAASGAETALLPMDPASPRHVYDLSKGLGETLCLNAAGGRGAVARLSNVFDDQGEGAGFLSGWLAAAKASRRVELASGRDVERDYIHVSDAVVALARIADAEIDIVNVASGQNVANAAIAQVLERHGWEIAFTGRPADHQPPQVDIARLGGLGLTPTPVTDWIERFAARQRPTG